MGNLPEKPNYKYGDTVVVAEGDPLIEQATEGDWSFPQPERKYVVKLVKLNPDRDCYLTTVIDCTNGRRYQDFDSDWFIKEDK